MKKRVIHIRGLSGIFLTMFVIACLFAGFILFPAYLTMYIWNYIATHFVTVSTIDICGGLLLWGIIIVSFLIFNKHLMTVSFGIPSQMSQEELMSLLQSAEKDINSEDVVIKSTQISNSPDKEEKTLQDCSDNKPEEN